MVKMKLDVDGLAVESFQTERVQGAGTVLAYGQGPTINNSSAVDVCICTVQCIQTQ